ncbi:hypothetical protein BDA96_10G171500 [Sorghum bicolor]|uniref:Uncharacterized protein n=2 Tax=Sorghum bicolor TaxID=4558 RepID=A0A921Q2N4_SORBI|nr:hypothetical protein BDA96_10G171500 [Sorghum bicolor]KAG0514217.1 hypothetical protein BDA96_10G171500 [Sorghum bicolor]KXG19935.1 hypothetical protein SORBI_3010G135900 [Sorghum bicolor]
MSGARSDDGIEMLVGTPSLLKRSILLKYMSNFCCSVSPRCNYCLMAPNSHFTHIALLDVVLT